MIKRYTRPGMGSIWEEENRFKKMLDVELVACEAFAARGLIPEAAYRAIKKKAKFDIKRIEEIEAVTRHDVIAFLTAVGENVGEESRYIHMGMTSSDVLDTALSLQLREASDIIIDDIKKVISSLKKVALEFKGTIMMGRTHGVHAEPITFGFKMAGWYQEMKRNLERMKRAKDIISVGKVSGVVGAFAHQDPDVEEFVCGKLGISPDPISTQIIQRDRHAEYMTVLAVIAASLEKFAIEIRHLHRSEVREVEEYFSKGQKGSSAMPHKKNPIVCERITGLARLIRANAMASLENVALWHERDISHSSVERVILPDSTIIIDYMLDKFNNLIKNLVVYPENMKNNMLESMDVMFSQRIMLELVKKGGISREKAYKMVQKNAMKVLKGAGKFKKMLMEDKEIKKYLNEKEIDKCLDVHYYTRNIGKVFNRIGLEKKKNGRKVK